MIYGQLKGTDVSDQTIRLYHHIAGGAPGYSLIGTTTTDSLGNYEFTRAEGIVDTNREWFVTGPNGSHSRTLPEQVQAQVTLTASTVSATTGRRIMFSGKVTPNHAFQRVLLQQQNGSSGDWHTLRSALLGPGSNYSVAYTWRTPGERDVRVELPADARNIRSDSDSAQVTIQQRQVTGFTINTSAPIQTFGQPVTISGVLTPGATAQPATVQLWSRLATGGPFQLIAISPVTSTGAYSFTEMPTVNTVYQARTTLGAVRHSAELWQGVRDQVLVSASSPVSTVGGQVTFSGTVVPDKAGHAIYLEHLGADGDWHPVEERFVSSGSTFQFRWRFATPGTFEFRARIYSDGHNVGTASVPVTVTVSGLAPVTTLPPVTAG